MVYPSSAKTRLCSMTTLKVHINLHQRLQQGVYFLLGSMCPIHSSKQNPHPLHRGVRSLKPKWEDLGINDWQSALPSMAMTAATGDAGPFRSPVQRGKRDTFWVIDPFDETFLCFFLWMNFIDWTLMFSISFCLRSSGRSCV